jgi:hypothetical protein
MPRPRPPVLAVLLGILAAAALAGLGRLTAPAPDAARARGYHDGTVAGYADGFSAGRARASRRDRPSPRPRTCPPAPAPGPPSTPAGRSASRT